MIRTEALSDGRLGAAVLIRSTNNEVTKVAVTSWGGYVRAEAGDVVVAVLPVEALGSLADLPETLSIEASHMRQSQLDVSRAATKADLVQSGSGLSAARTGAGVIVGIVDSGIDYSRDDFKTAGGATRIRSIWDISGVASGGAARVCSPTEINNSSCAERDRNGHGTHVASTAAGNGRLQAGFVGMAPDAEIIAAKATRSTTASGGFADDDVIAACTYIFQQAAAAGKPAVINMSIGGFASPLDGTSSYEQALSNLTGAGRLIVVSAGNSGSATANFGAEHLSYAVAGSNYLEAFETPLKTASDKSTGFVYLWYNSGSISVGVAARTSSSTNTAVASAAVGPGQSTALLDLKDSSDTVLAHYQIDASTTSYPGNGAHLVVIRFQPVASQYFSLYTFGNGTFDAWPINLTFDTRNETYWVPGDNQKTIGTPGTALKAITVGAYTTKKQWTDVNGTSRTFGSWCDTIGSDTIGDIACFSSRGPTRDGRAKPDITGPGHRIAAALSVDAIPNHDASDRLQGGKLLMESGTSMSAPHLTGIVALMLQANATLTYTTALQALQASATKDSFTGAVTNNTWGAGKVNALEAVKAVTTGGGGGPTVCTPDATTMCLLGGRYKVTSHWKNQYAGGAEATLQKAQLTDVTGAFWIANAETYEYLIRVNTATDNGRAWMAIPTFTSVEFWIAVTDTHTGQYKEYHSSPGNVTLIYDPTYFVYP
ncbi:MAG: S8 family serine peptidase [Thermoanaerobaculia bacterium]|nr:S8 family serine peptidase [Thermoanaerobaculia bacterium]